MEKGQKYKSEISLMKTDELTVLLEEELFTVLLMEMLPQHVHL